MRENRIKIEWKTQSELEGFIFLYFLTENQILGSLGGILETSWAVLAKFLSRLGPQLGSILDPKMALELPKSRPRGAYRTPKRPLGAKNHPKAAQSPPKPPREVPRPPLSLDFRGSTVAGTRLCRAEDMIKEIRNIMFTYAVYHIIKIS